MKISIIVSNSLRKDPRVIKQVRLAIAQGFEVQFVGFRDANYSSEFLDALGCRCDIVDLGEEYLGKLSGITKKIRRLVLQRKLACDYICDFNPDVIHSNDFDTLDIAYSAAKKTGAGLVYDSHEVFAENLGIAEMKLIKKLIIMRERYLVKRVNKMISVSNAAAAYFKEKYNVDPVVITNCPMKNTLPLKPKTTDAFEVVYQGLMIGQRGYEEFVRSAKFLDDGIRLVIRGYGPIENQLREIIQTEGLTDKVVFKPPVEVAELIPEASASHMGAVLTKPVNINFRLTVSNKIFEYISAGIPVLLSDVPEHRYLNDKFGAGIILEDVTPEKIADAINNVYRNPELFKSLSDGVDVMEKEMTWEKESEKLLDIYKEIARK